MDVSKILGELKSSFEEVKDTFSGHDVLIRTLDDKIKALEQRVQDIITNDVSYKPDVLGFANEDQAVNFVKFARAIYQRDPSIKDMSEGVDSEGGYLVPTEFRATLIRLIEIYGTIRKNATVIPMHQMEMDIPRLTSGVNVYWINEKSNITVSQPVFGNLHMVAKKLACLAPVTGELLEDSSIAIANLIATLIAESMAEEEDRVSFVGNAGGSDPFNGILYDSNVGAVTMGTGNTAFINVTADDLADMIAALKSSAAVGAKFYLHRTVFNVIRKLKDSQGDYIYSPPGNNQPGTIWGYPYELIEVMPAIADSGADKPFIAFGNLKHFYFGDRRKLSMAQSSHAGFVNDKIYLRGIERISLNVGLPQGFVALKTSAT